MLNYMKILIGLLSIFVILSITYYNKQELQTNLKEIKVYKEQDVHFLIQQLQTKGPTKTIEIVTKIVREIFCPDKIDTIDYIKKFIGNISCPSFMKRWSPGKPLVDLKTMSSKATNSTHAISITRAMVLNFPIDRWQEYEVEIRWLYRSWIEMQKHEPLKWRTDLVIFTQNDSDFFKNGTSFFDELNCKFSNRRTSKSDKPMCTLVEYLPLRKFQVPKETENRLNLNPNYKHLLTKVNIFSDQAEDIADFWALSVKNLKTYQYVDSVVVAFSGYSYFKSAGFDFLIRSDMDVFLTPLFATWLPYNCDDFYAGNGGYSTAFNKKRLKRITEDLGITNAQIPNLGSTWYSTPDQIRVAAYLSMVFMSYLYSEEFTETERLGNLGIQNWPDWHYGVLSMYGNDIALNHLSGSNQMNVVKLDTLIDFPSTNNFNPNEKLHIHVFHSFQMFSKFEFKSGKYDNMTVTDKDMDKISFYCLKMALDGKRIKAAELRKMLDQQTARKI